MNLFSFLTHSYHFKEIDSTQLFLKKNYQKLANLTFVSADYQTMGRGRKSRTWVSDKNTNLLFSFLIKDKELVNNFASLSLLSAVIVKKVLDKLNIQDVSIKWPNDVFVKDKKICGILLEGISNNNGLVGVVIGIGLNVNQNEFPDDLLNKATSISNEVGHKVNIIKIKKMIFKKIKKDFFNIQNSDYLTIARQSNYLLNKEVYAEINNKKVLVKVLDINDDNTLKVELDGKIISLSSGEVTFHL